jgi:hypothetical protein
MIYALLQMQQVQHAYSPLTLFLHSHSLAFLPIPVLALIKEGAEASTNTLVTLYFWIRSHTIPQLRTYTEILILYQFKNKENVLYSSLIKMQRFILSQDPNINELLDESFYNNMRIMLRQLRRQKKFGTIEKKQP